MPGSDTNWKARALIEKWHYFTCEEGAMGLPDSPRGQHNSQVRTRTPGCPLDSNHFGTFGHLPQPQFLPRTSTYSDLTIRVGLGAAAVFYGNDFQISVTHSQWSSTKTGILNLNSPFI